ncbi:hypothetical protein DMC63_37845 [Streptomyces sp. WAC 05977]|nr:hypothetical protein DMC63_37845 [Streptomyces sp. WAC 05977]
MNIAATPAADAGQAQPRVPASRITVPETKIDCVQSAIRVLLAATDLDPHTLAQELDQARKREVAEYVSVLADAVDRLTTLVGVAIDQADQFTGGTNEIAEVEHNLQCAHTGLSDLADELHPATS